jgi:CRISPR-associated protein Cas2
MQCVLVYDIPDDGKRAKVADVCLDYGLDRIQYSAFLGDLRVTHQEELMLKIAGVLGSLPGNVQLFPVCEKDWQARRCLVQHPVAAKAEDCERQATDAG